MRCGLPLLWRSTHVKSIVGQLGGGVPVGVAPTVIVAFDDAVCPLLSVTVRTTVYVPAAPYVWVTTAPDPPKLQE